MKAELNYGEQTAAKTSRHSKIVKCQAFEVKGHGIAYVNIDLSGGMSNASLPGCAYCSVSIDVV